MNANAVLALLGDLYAQIVSLNEEIAQLRAANSTDPAAGAPAASAEPAPHVDNPSESGT